MPVPATTLGELSGSLRHPRPTSLAPMASHGDSLALRCLNDAIDRAGIIRKVLADRCGHTEKQFSKLTSGAQGFPVSLLDALPLSIVRDFQTTYADARRERTRDELDEQIFEAIERLVALFAVRGRAAKAEIKR